MKIKAPYGIGDIRRALSEAQRTRRNICSGLFLVALGTLMAGVRELNFSFPEFLPTSHVLFSKRSQTEMAEFMVTSVINGG